MKIVLASGNRNKFLEIREAFDEIGVELLFGGDFEKFPEVDESGSTYEENALIKAKAWSEATGLPSLADDSGLEVEALEGAPGVYSARIIPGTDKDRVDWLMKKMEGIKNRRARFVSCLVIVFPDSNDPLICQKSCSGNLAEVSSGESGFGYDPVFIPEGYSKTFAELGDSIKRKISHRALSIKGIAEMLVPVLEYYTVRTMKNSLFRQ